MASNVLELHVDEAVVQKNPATSRLEVPHGRTAVAAVVAVFLE